MISCNRSVSCVSTQEMYLTASLSSSAITRLFIIHVLIHRNISIALTPIHHSSKVKWARERVIFSSLIVEIFMIIKCAIYLHIFTLFAANRLNQKLAKIHLDKANSPIESIYLSDNSRIFSFPKSFVHFLLSHHISFLV